MFSVRHQDSSGARLFETDAVYYEARADGGPGMDNVTFTTPGGAFMQITTGSVFVMNDIGKTVDQYHFRSQLPPAQKDTGTETGAVSAREHSSAIAA